MSRAGVRQIIEDAARQRAQRDREARDEAVRAATAERARIADLVLQTRSDPAAFGFRCAQYSCDVLPGATLHYARDLSGQIRDGARLLLHTVEVKVIRWHWCKIAGHPRPTYRMELQVDGPDDVEDFVPFSDVSMFWLPLNLDGVR